MILTIWGVKRSSIRSANFNPYGMEAWQVVQNRLNELVDVPVHFKRIAATVEDR